MSSLERKVGVGPPNLGVTGSVVTASGDIVFPKILKQLFCTNHAKVYASVWS